jgi:hypothetical protein
VLCNCCSEPFIEKIKSPVVCLFGDKKAEFADGRMLFALFQTCICFALLHRKTVLQIKNQ